eukprot:scpid94095/ scgid21033/ 
MLSHSLLEWHCYHLSPYTAESQSVQHSSKSRRKYKYMPGDVILCLVVCLRKLQQCEDIAMLERALSCPTYWSSNVYTSSFFCPSERLHFGIKPFKVTATGPSCFYHGSFSMQAAY